MVSIADLENQLKESEEVVASAESLEKLLKNRDFRKVILEGFMGSEVARNMAVFADHTLEDCTREGALGMAQASGYLKQWLVAQAQLGQQARNKVNAIKEEIELMRAEEQDGPGNDVTEY